MGVLSLDMQTFTTNNRWVRNVKENQNGSRKMRKLTNYDRTFSKTRNRQKNDKWKSFKKKKDKQSYMYNNNLIIKIKNKTYVYPPKAGVLIFNNDKTKVLVIENAYNPKLSKWGLPKGHLEDGESRIQCASRELLEETGINLNIDERDSYIKINNSIYYVYYTDENRHTIKPIDLNEIKQAKFLDIVTVKKLKINRELTVAITNKLKLAKKLAKFI